MDLRKKYLEYKKLYLSLKNQIEMQIGGKDKAEDLYNEQLTLIQQTIDALKAQGKNVNKLSNQFAMMKNRFGQDETQMVDYNDDTGKFEYDEGDWDEDDEEYANDLTNQRLTILNDPEVLKQYEIQNDDDINDPTQVQMTDDSDNSNKSTDKKKKSTKRKISPKIKDARGELANKLQFKKPGSNQNQQPNNQISNTNKISIANAPGQQNIVPINKADKQKAKKALNALLTNRSSEEAPVQTDSDMNTGQNNNAIPVSVPGQNNNIPPPPPGSAPTASTASGKMSLGNTPGQQNNNAIPVSVPRQNNNIPPPPLGPVPTVNASGKISLGNTPGQQQNNDQNDDKPKMTVKPVTELPDLLAKAVQIISQQLSDEASNDAEANNESDNLVSNDGETPVSIPLVGTPEQRNDAVIGEINKITEPKPQQQIIQPKLKIKPLQPPSPVRTPVRKSKILTPTLKTKKSMAPTSAPIVNIPEFDDRINEIDNETIEALSEQIENFIDKVGQYKIFYATQFANAANDAAHERYEEFRKVFE